MYHWQKDDLAGMEKRYRANLINTVAGFKPALLVGTADKNGLSNLAIFSTIFHIGAAPPLIGMLVRPNPEGTQRHTLDNIIATGVYTLNHFPLNRAEKAHQTSARYPRGQSEFSAAGFEIDWHDEFAAPFVAGSRIQLGMELAEHQLLTVNNTHLVIGRVTSVHVAPELVREDGTVNLAVAESTVVAGLDSYHSVNPGQRFAYAKPTLPPKRID